MAGSKLQGSDLTGAVVWRAEPPAVEGAGLSDSAQIVLRPPNEEELRGLIAALTRIESGPLKARLTDAIGVLANPAQNAAWANSSEQQLWQGLAKSSELASDGYKARLTEFLWRLMCRSRFANGGVATGIARRALAPGFKGDTGELYDKLRAKDCPASPAISAQLMRELAAASDAARGQ
jgi:hypothetical protein